MGLKSGPLGGRRFGPRRRSAVSTAVVGAVAVIIVVALVGGYIALTSSSSKTSSSTTISTTTSKTTTSSISQSSSTSTTSASGGGYFPFAFDLINAQYAQVGEGDYTEIVVLQITHSLSVQNESVTMTSSAPTGVSLTYEPTNLVVLSGSSTVVNVTLVIAATTSAQPGNDTIQISGTSGSLSQSINLPVKVVQYDVVIQSGMFEPAVLNVTAGSTVYWQNLDGPALVCGVASPGGGQHSVVFTTIPGANSSTLKQFQSYSYTFNTPGSYFYYSSIDSDHSVNGTINVLAANGGIGDSPIIPTFSNFKPGSQIASLSGPASVARPDTASGLEPENQDVANAHLSSFEFGAMGGVTALGGIAILYAMLRTARTRAAKFSQGQIAT